MGSEPLISSDVLARYAGDAASEVTGVAVLGHEVEIADSDGAVTVKLHIELEWGKSAAETGKKAQRRVREYVERMTSKKVEAVEVVVERVTAPPA